MSRSKKSRKGASHSDPHEAREARKYDNPIPSREFIMGLLEEGGVPLSFGQIHEALELDDEEQREALFRRLRAMERDGQVVVNRKGGYCLVDAEDLIAGRVIGHPDGFGFLTPDEAGDDLFLGPRQMRSLWHGDRAVVRVVGVDRKGRREGALIEVLERAHSQVVGRLSLEQDDEVGFVAPDNKRLTHDVVVPGEHLNGATNGQMVVVDLVRQPDRHRQPLGHVAEVLGDHLAPGMETDVAIRAHDIPCDWPEEVLGETAKFGKTVPTRAKRDREDLRAIPLVTIDGEDSRDFDDAVYAKRTKSGWKLIVAIADVSHYVKPGTALDAEAIKRGNSVYFPDRVVPMLPEELSNGLCSINPKVDRLCMAAEILIKESGEQVRSRFFPAVMRSHARLTYGKVNAMVVEGDPDLCEEYAELLPDLHELYALYQALRAAREVRGAIDFDTVEPRFHFDDQGKVESVSTVQRNDAHKLIEECMLAANVAAARQLLRKKIPALYRNHERPNEQKLEDLRKFLAEMGLSLGGGDEPTALDYAALLAEVAERENAHMIQTVLLRSMMQAQYGTENVGHFGLSFPAYAHFTSPIRRYPDLMVHRALKHLIADGKADDFDYSHLELANLGEHCSMTERRADEATRDASDALKCEFMLDKVGSTFEGKVVSVTGFGLFVELADIYITGLVHITALDKDFFHFDPVHHKLSGENSGKVYRLTDTIEVTVAAVNLDDRKIDLMLAGVEPGEERPRGGKPKGRGRDRGKGKTRDRRGGRHAATAHRLDMPDEQPFEHPVAVEAPPEASQESTPTPEPAVEAQPKGKGRGKASRAKGGRKRAGRERPALLAGPDEHQAEPEQEGQPRSGKRRRKGSHPARRRAAERPALLAPADHDGGGAAPERAPAPEPVAEAPADSERASKPKSKRGRGKRRGGRDRQSGDAAQQGKAGSTNTKDKPKSKPKRQRKQPAAGEVDGNRREPDGNREVAPPPAPPEVDGNRADYVPLSERKKKSTRSKKKGSGGGRRRKPVDGNR